ncbi:MAG: glycerate kinase [Planctomycetota bacterium]
MNDRGIIAACASFKGTLTSRAAGEAVARGLLGLGLKTRVLALADGGEGLVDALASQAPGALKVGAPCRGPLLTPRTAVFAILPQAGTTTNDQPQRTQSTQRETEVGLIQNPIPTGRDKIHNSFSVSSVSSVAKGHRSLAVIEMAASSGLNLVPAAERDPKLTTSLGVGDQILAALEHQRGAVEILLGLGGSATNDGGAGMAEALGARFLDAVGKPLPPGGAALLKLAHIDVSQLDTRLKNVPVTVACDVRNPLTGPEGASHVFGAQKGGTPDDLKLLDAALAHYAEVIERDLGKDVANIPGAGAAGGLGAGCLAFLNATLKPGIELVLDALDFDALLADTALVITGEGRLDRQTLMGKAPAGVAARAKRRGVPCVAIGGQIEPGAESELLAVFARIESLSQFAGSSGAAMREPGRWLENLVKAKAQDWLAT